MEVIWNELQRNGVNIDKQTFSDYMNHLFEDHGELYQEMARRLDSKEIIDVFHCMNVNSVGRAMSFLALLYYRREFDENLRECVRLVAGVLKLKTL